jgi:hypothetical protein
MIVKCYNCGKLSPDKEEWELVAKLHWSSSSKQWLSSENRLPGETLEEQSKRIGHNWYCPKCMKVGLDSTFGIPIKMEKRRN